MRYRIKIAIGVLVVAFYFGLAFYLRHCNQVKFNMACDLYEQGDYQECLDFIETLNLKYNGVSELECECHYAYGVSLYNRGNYNDAIDQFIYNISYKDTREYVYSMLKEGSSDGK